MATYLRAPTLGVEEGFIAALADIALASLRLWSLGGKRTKASA